MERYLQWKLEKDNAAFENIGKDVGRGRPQWALDMVGEFEEENALLG